MSLFRTETERGVWIEMNCQRCWHYASRNVHDAHGVGDPAKPQCPILIKAIARDRKPVEWDRNLRATTIAQQYKCNEQAAESPRIKRQDKQFEDVPMFDVTPYATEVGFVPVEGWPDRPGTSKEVDHQ